MAVVSCDTGPEFLTAQTAAEWVRRLYADVSVTLDREAACLASSQRDARSLELIWQCSLANERLLAAGAAQRAAIIDELTQ